MVKVWPSVVGKTFDSENKILKRLRKRGAKIVETSDESDAIIVFCPIVSRFETDITSALSNVPESNQVIVVALHHTYDLNYTVPENKERDGKLVVNCLFFEKKGLLTCQRNSVAKKMIYKALKLPEKANKLSIKIKTAGKSKKKRSAEK